jgi:peptidoglycan/xylan/chitin deacetylase (PgdA/CDA1 family)
MDRRDERPEKLAAVSVDLDEIPCYAAIFGIDAPREAARAIYDKALARFDALFAREEIPATFFAIGRDLDRENGARLKALAERGHEIANHSLSHFYDLTRRDRREMTREVAGGIEAIERATSVVPVGFRAPGYTINDALFEVLAELRVGYDSSVFPCPSYYSAKAAAISTIRLRGRRSHSIVDDPRVLSAPADPYRIGDPYWRRGDGMIELPIGVTRAARLPYIGTTVVLSGTIGASVLTRMIAGRPLVNLELHGIDLADAREDGLQFLAPHQRDLRVSAADKEAALASAFARLRSSGYRFVTLREAAREASERFA